MGDLEQALEAMARKAKSLLARNGEVGEENTKAVLIDPTLEALGWDIHDLDDVQREYRHKSKRNPVDYAFFIAGRPKMFLEAKPLGANLRDHKWRAQVVNYANTAGVEWCVLTDGNTWQVYKSTAPVELDRKLFLETWLHSVEGRTPPFAPAYVLGLLSKENLAEKIPVLWQALYVDRTAEGILLGLVREKDKSLLRLLVKRSKEKESELTKRDVEAWLGRATLTVETSLGELPQPEPVVEAPPKKKRKPPLVPGLPTKKTLRIPLLQAIVRRGGEVKVSEAGAAIDRELADGFNVTEEQRRFRFPGRKETVWRNRVRWARQALVDEGLLDGSRRGIWAVTEKGRQRAEQDK